MDEESLADILAFLDEFDVPEETVSAASSTNRNLKKQPKKSWHQSRKDELLTLQALSKQLETRLEELNRVRLASSNSEVAFVQVSEWEKAARRQLERRQQSEQENAQLREVIRYHRDSARALRRAFKRKLRENSIPLVATPNPFYARGVSPPLNNVIVFDKLMAGMDEMYLDLDSFLDRAKMSELPTTGPVLTSGAQGNFMEMLDSHALPFTLQQTEDVVWSSRMKNPREINMIFEQDFATQCNTRMKSLSFEFNFQGLDSRIMLRVVKKKFVEQDRVVILQRTLIEPIIDQVSVAFVETIRKVLVGNKETLSPITMMQTHCEVTLRGELASPSSNDKYPTQETVIDTWRRNLTLHNHNIENQLLLANK